MNSFFSKAMLKQILTMAFLLFSFTNIYAQFQFELLHPRYLNTGRYFESGGGALDSNSRAIIQLRALGESCVRVSFAPENLDTVYYLNDTTLNLTFPLQIPEDEALFLDGKKAPLSINSNQPISVSLYLQCDRIMDSILSLQNGERSRVRCLSRLYSEATDIGGYKGSSYRLANFHDDHFRDSVQKVTRCGSCPEWEVQSTGELYISNAYNLDTIFFSQFDSLSLLVNKRLNFPLANNCKAPFLGASIDLDTNYFTLNRQSLQNFGFFFRIHLFPPTIFRPPPFDYRQALHLFTKNDSSAFSLLFGSTGEAFGLDIPIGHFQYYEEHRPREYAAQLHFLKPFAQTDSGFASVIFWQDQTELYANGSLIGVFPADTILRWHYDNAVVLESSAPIQVMAGSFPTENRSVFDFSRGSNFRAFWGDYLSTGYLASAPQHWIKQTLFRPVLPPDTSTAAFVDLTCPTASVGQMLVNGQGLPATQWQTFAHRPEYSYATVALERDSNYYLENPAGFNAVHYSRPLKSPGFVRLYAKTLTETPIAPRFFNHFQWRLPGDTSWHSGDTLSLCTETQLELRIPQARFTTWEITNPLGADTVLQTGAEESTPLWLKSSSQAGEYWLYACDLNGCLPCDSLLVVVEPLVADLTTARAELNCEGYYLSAQAESNDPKARYRWFINGEELNLDNPRARLQWPLAQWPGQRDFLEISVQVESRFCDTLLALAVERPGEESLFPNVFTPNGDGVNDCFGPINPDLLLPCARWSVYNRNGLKLWDSDSGEDCWDGNFRKAPVSSGVYFFILDLGNGVKEQSFLHLQR